MYRIYSYLFFVCATVMGLSVVFLNKKWIPIIPVILLCSLVYLSFIVYEIFCKFFLIRKSAREKVDSLGQVGLLKKIQPWVTSSFNITSWLVFLSIFVLLSVGSFYGLGIFFMKNFGVDILTSLSAPQESLSAIKSSVDKMADENSKTSQALNDLATNSYREKFLIKNSQKYISNTTQGNVFATVLFDKIEYYQDVTPKVYAIYSVNFTNPLGINVSLSGRNNPHILSFNISDIIKQVRLLSYYPKSLKGLPVFILTAVLEDSQSVTVYYPKSINNPPSTLDVNNDYSTDVPVSNIEYKDQNDSGFSLTFVTKEGTRYTNLYVPDSYGNIEVID